MKELLSCVGVSAELSRDEFVRRLHLHCVKQNQVSELRSALFKAAMDQRLADEDDIIVIRRKVRGGKTMRIHILMIFGF